MNEFFKLLMPQLLEYFKDEAKVLKFVPKILLEYISESEGKEVENETTNKWWNYEK